MRALSYGSRTQKQKEPGAGQTAHVWVERLCVVGTPHLTIALDQPAIAIVVSGFPRFISD